MEIQNTYATMKFADLSLKGRGTREVRGENCNSATAKADYVFGVGREHDRQSRPKIETRISHLKHNISD